MEEFICQDPGTTAGQNFHPFKRANLELWSSSSYISKDIRVSFTEMNQEVPNSMKESQTNNPSKLTACTTPRNPESPE